MNRRDFLKLGSLMSAFAYVTASPLGNIAKLPIETVAAGKVYRGTYDGNVYTSQNGGKSWKLHSRFGPDCSIMDIFTGFDGRLYAHLVFKQYSFHLVLAQNGTSWLSEPSKISINRMS